MYGWICPKCGSVYGPQQIECYRCNGETKYEIKATWTNEDYSNKMCEEEKK